MKPAIMLLVFMAIFNGMVYAVFKMVKRNNRVFIQGADQSMEPSYKAGTTFILSPDIQRSKDIKVNEAVAYYLPNNSDVSRVGWVLAKEGQKISCDNDKWYLNGEPVKKTQLYVLNAHKINEYTVPRGCVFIVPNTQHDEDATVVGPIPLRCVLGRMPAPSN